MSGHASPGAPGLGQPGALPPLPPQLPGRKATWFELFFDLVFVVGVAQLSGTYAHHFDLAGAAGSVVLLLVLWWCWLGHTFHATRFDQQRPGQRLLGLAQIVSVCFIAYGVSHAHGERALVFALGLAAFKGLLALGYGLEWRWRGARPLIRAYASLYLLQAALWAASAALESPWRLGLWLLALGLDLVSPWWVARHTTAVPPHPEHLPERFGLFTIILLGEGVAAAVHALDHGDALHGHALVAALVGLALSFATWWGYFEVTRAHGEREVEGAAGGRHLRLWAYGHVPIYVGVFSLAAATVALAGLPQWPPGPLVLAGAGAALIPLGLAILRAASRPPG